jgi:hypothetical protein
MTFIDVDTDAFWLLEADASVSYHQRQLLRALSEGQGGQLELWFVTRDRREFRFKVDEQKPIIPWQRFLERVGEPLYYIRVKYHELGARRRRSRRRGSRRGSRSRAPRVPRARR